MGNPMPLRRRFAVFVAALLVSGGAAADPSNMPLSEYLAKKRVFAADYRSARSVCAAKPWRDGEICRVEALGRDVIAKADLEVAYRSTPRTRYEASEARSTADFWLTRERCADVDHRLQRACLQDAKAVQLAARAEAEQTMKIAESRRIADEARATARAVRRQPAAARRAREAAPGHDSAPAGETR
jgi:hypothetical protein